MHIPQGMVEGLVCPATAVVAAGSIVPAAVAAARAKAPPAPAAFASVSAFVFAAQMLNFPIAAGTSGHLIGGVLASAVLGVPFGILAITLVLIVQCLVFADGGLGVLGANILSMAVVGAGLGGALAGWKERRTAAGWLRLGIAAWASVVVAALATCLMLALSGASPLGRCLPPMLGIHALIGAAEAVLTVAVVMLLPCPAPSAPGKAGVWAMAAVFAVLILAPLASPLPDGLEWAAEVAGFAKSVEPQFVAPLADYEVPGLHPWLSTALAGLAGIVLTAAIAFGIGRLVPSHAKA